jgi:hypothetical protein
MGNLSILFSRTIQNPFPWKNGLGGVVFLIPLLTVPIFPTPLVQRPESVCDAEAFITSRRVAVTLHPKAVVALPWEGRHQVFGIFQLPEQLASSTVLLKVQDVGVYCDAVVNSGKSVRAVEAPPGYFLMIDNIRTRTAFRLIVQGKFNNLRNPLNWSMVYHINSSGKM